MDNLSLESERQHNDYINGIVISSNNEFFATASSDKTIKVWNLHTWKLITTLTHHIS